MENSNLSSGGQISPIQIFKNFIGFYNGVQPIKDTLHKLFIGFFASQENFNLDPEERCEIAFHFNQITDLITSVGNFDVAEYEASINLKNTDKEKESLERSVILQNTIIERLEVTLNDKRTLIELMESKLNRLTNKQNERKVYFNKKTA